MTRRPPYARLLLAAASALAVWLSVTPSWSQDRTEVRCRQVEAEVRCSLDLRANFEPKLLEKLRSGFVNRILYRIYIRRAADDEPMALAALRLVEVYELWDEEYYVYQGDRSGEKTTSKSPTKVVELLAVFDDMTIVEDLPPGRYYADVIVELNPIGEQEEAAIRSWIARSRGADRTFASGDRSLFGTFVSLFVNIRPGAAERAFRARTPAFDVSKKP